MNYEQILIDIIFYWLVSVCNKMVIINLLVYRNAYTICDLFQALPYNYIMH